jgi:hypothetical protein
MNSFAKALAERVVAAGDLSPGQWHFVADLLELSAREAVRWSYRQDDAERFHEVLWEAAEYLRGRAVS